MDLPIWDIMKYHNMWPFMSVFSHLVCFHIHPHSIYQCFFLWHDPIPWLCICHILFSIHPLLEMWVAPNLWLLWIMLLWIFTCAVFDYEWVRLCTLYNCVLVFTVCVFSSLGVSRSAIVGSHDNSVQILRNHQTIFHSGCMILYPPAMYGDYNTSVP